MKKIEPQRFFELFVWAMRIQFIIAVILCSTNLLVFANAHAQAPLETNVTIDLKDVLLKDALAKVSKQTGVKFLFSDEVAKSTIKLSSHVSKVALGNWLSSILAKYPYNFKVVDNAILIEYNPEKAIKKSPDDPANKARQPQHISGKITDKSGQALGGVTVIVKKKNVTVVTDAEGRYEISVNVNEVLVFSYIGYQTQEITILNQHEIDITLLELTSQLDQVQVIGYGTTTRRLSTGNVSTVKSDVISQQPITNPLQALEGRVAGLQITQGSGLPGSSFSVQIRGRNSIAALNSPLYIVDGVPFTSTNVETFNSGGMGNPLNTIAPSDIESIDILKDADATAIYGSRAANGVILITTKKGKAGAAKLDITVNSGVGTVSRTAQTLNAQQYLQLRHDAFTNSDIVPDASNAPDLFSWNQNENTNWQKWYMGNTAKTTDVIASYSGGNEQTTFLISGTYHHERTVEPTSDGYNRGNVHFNINHTSTDKKFQLDASIFYTSDANIFHDPSALFGVAKSVPFYPVYDNVGNFNWVDNLINYKAEFSQYVKEQTDNLNGNLNLKYNLLPGLYIKGSVGYNRISSDQIAPYPSTSQNPAYQPTGYSIFGDRVIQTVIFEPQVTYTKQMGRSNLTLLAGATIQQSRNNDKQISVFGYSSDLLLENPGYGTAYANGTNPLYKYMSFFGRATYNFSDKYIVNGSLRRDGSSRFGPGKQFGNFGSVGAAWIFSNEDFIKNSLEWLSFGKLRGSYGTTGNDGIGDYGFLSTYSSFGNYGNTPTITPTQIANANFEWEVNKKLELALDLGIIKDRILFSMSWYRNRSSNELVGYPLPSLTGFSSYQANLPALVQNKGFEFEVNTENFQKGSFTWKTSLNLTIPQNRLLSFPGLASTTYANQYIIGQPLNVIQAFHFLGVDPATGLTQIQDVNKDGRYSYASSYNNQGGDYVVAGNTDPKWYGGISNTFKYKEWELNIFFQYTKQSGYNLAYDSASLGDIYNSWTSNLSYWKKPGDITTVPKPLAQYDPTLGYYALSDASISDASYLRLKNISLSYTFPQKTVNKLGVKNFLIYLKGQNVLTFTKYKGYDPELASNPNIYIPTLRMFTAGIQCSL